jgi:hypothetical protein
LEEAIIEVLLILELFIFMVALTEELLFQVVYQLRLQLILFLLQHHYFYRKLLLYKFIKALDLCFQVQVRQLFYLALQLSIHSASTE